MFCSHFKTDIATFIQRLHEKLHRPNQLELFSVYFHFYGTSWWKLKDIDRQKTEKADLKDAEEEE